MASWTATAITIDITPTSPVMLAGFASRAEPYRDVFSPLEANLLLLDDGEVRVLLVSLDLLFVGSEILEFVQRTCSPYLPTSNVLVAATHTHGAPATDRHKPLLGAVDDGYLAELKAKLECGVLDLFKQRPTPVEARLKQGSARHSINRRRTTTYWSQEGIRRVQEMAPNPTGYRDERIRMLELSSNGAVQAMIWHYACHPVSFPDLGLVTADFPGIARNSLRRNIGTTVPVLFFQGFSGDIRPSIVEQSDDKSWNRRVRDFLDGEHIVFGKKFARATLLQWEAWVDGLAKAVSATQNKLGTRIFSGLRVGEYGLPLARIREDVSASLQSSGFLQFQQFSFGNQLKLLGVSAEVVSPYIRFLPANTLGMGCVGDVFGYYPTDSMLSEGGYEVDEFAHYFGLPGKFRDGLNDAFRDALREI